MGYYDGLTDGQFKKDSQGRDLFFPYGAFGLGFIFESESQRHQIRNVLKSTINRCLQRLSS